MTAPLTNETVLWLAVIAGVTLVVLVDRVASIFRPDRIETAIRDATSDLLGVLAQIECDTTVIASACHEQLERDREYREDEGHVDEAPGTSLHGLFADGAVTWSADEWINRYAMPRVDLRKPE